MFIVKNAITSIKRNKGRNILIGCIVIVLSCALTISLAIKNTSDSLIHSYEEASEITASITFNRGNMMEKFDPQNKDNFENMKEEFSKFTTISKEDIETYAKSEYVEDYYYTASLGVNSDIEKASSNFSFGNNRGPKREENQTDFTLIGYSSIRAMQEFINGEYTLNDYDNDIWDKILNGNFCLVNYELAILNNISVGDTFKIIDSENQNNTYDLTVVGIFKENKNEDQKLSMFSNSANTIITNTEIVEKMGENNEKLIVNNTPQFTLKSKDSIKNFESELHAKGLDENYILTTNLDEIENATSSISNVGSFAQVFLIMTIIIGAIILFVINCVNIRERKYEIGVLRTIGMKKKLLATQFILELVIVSFIALLLGAGIGAILSKPISNNLLSSEIKKSEENTNQMKDNFGGNIKNGREPNLDNFKLDKIGGVAKVEAFTSINAVVNYKVIIELIGICLIITLISSFSSIMNIVRFRPLDILKERS